MSLVEDNPRSEDVSGRAWLDNAHQGPLPQVAADAAMDAIRSKQSPVLLTDKAFAEVPRQLKSALGKLIGVPAGEVILGNSTTYGLHLLSHGLPLATDDEVLLVEGDFPATVVPWLMLRRRGISVRLVRPAGGCLTVADLVRECTSRTKVVCSSWVFSFTGHAVDVAALGEFCRERGVVLVVNASQALGAREVCLDQLPVDALVSCGHKWLCGPYGTGLAWIRPDILGRLQYAQPYWLHGQSSGDLGSGFRYEFDEPAGAARYDVFATANFFNYTAWTAAVRHLLTYGPAAIAEYDQRLVDRLIRGLDLSRFTLLSPRSGPERSTLVLVSHLDRARNPLVHAALRDAGVDVALRDGRLRLSPHLHNTVADIDRALDVLRGF